MALKLKVIIGSTRPGRLGPKIGAWVAAAAAEIDGFDTELVDLHEMNLPLLDEPKHPRMQQYEKDHTKRWSAVIDDADAFIFVTPEYDYFPPASLINALQTLSNEWKYKPAGIVSYGGVSGGLRAAEVLRRLMSALNMVALPEVVPLPFFAQFIDAEGKFVPNDKMAEGATILFDALAKWGEALAPMRSA